MSRDCNVALKVAWDQEYENWVVIHKNTIIYEFLTGKKIDRRKVQKHFHNIRNRDYYKETQQEAIDQRAKNEAKLREEKEESAKHHSKELVKYARKGKMNLALGVKHRCH